MSVTCAVCKKTPIPCDSRSFHKFPSKSDLKQKWMEILGVTSVKSSWRVCSDHFSPTSFHEQTGYNNSRRRVLPNSLPNKPPNTCSGVLSDISNVDFEDTEKRSQDFLNCTSTEVVDASNSANETLENDNSIGSDSVEDKRLPSAAEEECSASITEPLSQSPFTASVEQGHNEENPSYARKQNASANLKRKRLDNDLLMRRNKKFCFKDGHTMRCISRSHLVSDEAWNTFLRYTILKERVLKSCRKKILRKDKKIGNFKELIAALKGKQH